MLRMGTGWLGGCAAGVHLAPPFPSPSPWPSPAQRERELCKTTSFRRKPESRGDQFVAGQVRRTSHLVAF